MNNKSINSDELLVEKARKQLRNETGLRWAILALGGLFLWMCYFAFSMIFQKIDQLGQDQVTVGFVAGFSLSFTCATFGVLGGLCIAKFIQGFAIDTQRSKLLVKYHDRLINLVGKENM